jgi:ketosteroid isomerase-like protein
VKDIELSTPEQAETAFYSAFENADLEAMMSVWSNDESIVCIHPHGPRLTGHAEVRDSWRQIMANSPRMIIRIDELNTVMDDGLAIRLVNEHIRTGPSAEPELTILATNVYRRTSDGWRIIVHHASPTPEALRSMADHGGSEDSGKVTVH